jgi:gamma-glutamyltranspeptidase/glutathione hydrolase
MTFDRSGPVRNSVLAGRFMVASSHHAISTAGASILASGGNAIDATLAMAAMSWLALPGQCGPGGDAFALVREPDGSMWTVGGSGFGPDGGELGFYRDRGNSAIPLRGALAVAVPGAPAALSALHAAGATLALGELWAAAIRAAERGLPCSAKNRADILEHESTLGEDQGTREIFLRRGRAPRIGEFLPNPGLARSIRMLARDPACFYMGEIAERAIAALIESGAPFAGAEWAATGEPITGPPISAGYRDVTVHETPLPTPGWMVLQQAALLDGLLASAPYLSPGAIDLMAEAARRSFRDRWAYCASDTDAWRRLLEPEVLCQARGDLGKRQRDFATNGLKPDGDTTSTVAVDGDGRAVSFIHSLAFTFGAQITIPETGIVLNNRLGRGAYLIEGHPNAVRPRRRPLHTLNAWLVTDREGQLLHVGNTPGGDGQVQWNMQLLSHLVDNGLDPQAAVTAPRFTVVPGADANVIGAPDELLCEARVGVDTLRELAELGHAVRTVGPWDAGGSALIVSADVSRGLLAGGTDPRQDGVALGG